MRGAAHAATRRALGGWRREKGPHLEVVGNGDVVSPASREVAGVAVPVGSGEAGEVDGKQLDEAKTKASAAWSGAACVGVEERPECVVRAGIGRASCRERVLRLV